MTAISFIIQFTLIMLIGRRATSLGALWNNFRMGVEERMTTRKKNFLLTALTLSALTVHLPLASAASSGGGQSEMLEEYSLAEIVVTATRTEKRDADQIGRASCRERV